jgi:hypothetical protein
LFERLLLAAGGAVRATALGAGFGALFAAGSIATLAGMLGGGASNQAEGRERDDGAEDQFSFHSYFRFLWVFALSRRLSHIHRQEIQPVKRDGSRCYGIKASRR